MRPLSVKELFDSAQLEVSARVSWQTPVPELQPGIYVVVANAEQIDVSHLPQSERDFWIPGQSIVYIGCTKRSLRTRLNQFYRHRFGDRSPHRGGQALTLLKCQLWVYWACPDDPHHNEHVLIEEFKNRTGGRRPFGNRRNEKKAMLEQLETL